MVLIISDEFDSSTTKVIKWLEYFNTSWIRINYQEEINIGFNGDEIILFNNKIQFYLSEIKSVWYRKGFLNFKIIETEHKQFNNLIEEEFNLIVNYIYYRLNKIKSLNSILNSNVNKLIVSDIARDLGFNTPKDYLVSNKLSLDMILSKNKYSDFISKVISGNCMQNFKNFTVYNYTKSIIKTKNLSDNFFPSLIQNKIDKKYEIRVFYIDNQFYSMAILSQKDNMTRIDYRNYNYEKPNRYVPYNLPNQVKIKIKKLMNVLKLNSGSIDLIYSNNKKYFFLEVNPVGQFGMVSSPCNFNLEKIIAIFLKNDK